MPFDFQTRPLALWVPIALASIYAIRTIKRHATHKLPPGLKGIPFFGNLFQLSTMPGKEFEVWRKQYDSLMYITVVGQGILVLNSHKAASDLLDRRGRLYSDRPRMIMASELLTGGLFLSLTRYGESWRRMRRACHEAINKTRIVEFYPTQSKEAILLADGLLQNPGAWEGELRRATASSGLSIVYGLPTISSLDDPAVIDVNRFNEVIVEYANTGNYLVELFPWMKYIPSSLAKWKREAEEASKFYTELFKRIFREVEDRINQGDEQPSFSGTLIRERQHNQLTDSEAAWLSATMYAGGAETTTSTMIWFMLAMIAFPEKQRKCQEELDTVVGRSRMPTLSDQNSLPYLRATVREALRWRPVTPLGIQHYTTKDDWYQGIFIPKGTICLANIWSLNRDRGIYGDDADDFNPDRFIDEHLSPRLADTRNEGHMSFGFGPRICIGRHIANNSLFINIASILWAANISAVNDKAGKSIIPDTLETVNAGIVVRPLPFDCVVSPRFPQVGAIITQTKELLQ